MGYKYCMVPQCKNTTTKTPDKIFVSVPSDSQMRKKWLQVAGRNPDEISTASKLYTCEDHFNVSKFTDVCYNNSINNYCQKN